jgi:hypothetical protein
MSKIFFPLPKKQIASPILANFSSRRAEETYFKQFVSRNETQHLQETTRFVGLPSFAN